MRVYGAGAIRKQAVVPPMDVTGVTSQKSLMNDILRSLVTKHNIPIRYTTSQDGGPAFPEFAGGKDYRLQSSARSS